MTLATGGGALRVLIVEDDPGVSRLALRALTRANYDIRAVALGQDAIALFEAEQWLPDLVLSDLELPDMTGLDLLRWCREHGKRIPFLLSSGDSEALAALDGRAIGATILGKPWELGELDRAVRRALAQ